MRALARRGLLALVAVATPAVAVRGTSAQAPPATTPPAAKPAAGNPAAAATQPMATVNGETITRGEVLDVLSRYPIPPGSEQQAYRDAVDTAINNRLIVQFLNRQRFNVPPQKIDDQIALLEKQLKQDGSDLATELLRTNKSMADLRREFAERIRWVDYLNQKATDGELKQFADAHKDLFNGTQVRASHILLKVDPKASAEEKEKVRQKLLAIKKDIQDKKISFAEAANKFSEDPANADGAGGDVGYFTLNSGFIEEFANAAFGMKKGQISDPVETPYGLHLIEVTDRKDGGQFDFEQNKLFVKQVYAADLQKRLLTAERKAAKIDVKPMPADLFPPAPSTGTTKEK